MRRRVRRLQARRDLEKEVDSYITFLIINEKKIKKESDLLW